MYNWKKPTDVLEKLMRSQDSLKERLPPCLYLGAAQQGIREASGYEFKESLMQSSPLRSLDNIWSEK